MRVLLLALLFLVAGCPSSATTTNKPGTSSKAKKPKKKPGKKKKARPKQKDVAVVEPDEPETEPPDDDVLEVLEGRAVWYGKNWHGKATASGEKFDMHAMTAAHRDLPLGSVCRVTNERNGKSVTVRINDRGPYGKDRRRIIDLSYAAATKLDFIDAGWTEVTIEVLEKPAKKTKKKKGKR